MLSRREVLQGIAVAPIAALPVVKNDQILALRQALDELKERIQRDFPEMKSVQIAFNPDDAVMPIMIAAFRV